MTLGVMLLTLYTVTGGMRAVIATDTLHFVVALAIIPLLVHLMLYQAGGFRAILEVLSPEQLHLFSSNALIEGKGTKTVTAGIISVMFPGLALSFPFMQRLLLAKHQGQTVGMYRGVAAVFIPFVVLVGLIGLIGIPLHPPSHRSVLLSAIAPLAVGTKGIFWVAVLGIILSTADSFLHAAGLAFVHDTLKPLADRWGQDMEGKILHAKL